MKKRRIPQKQKNKETILCLCATCAGQFYDSPEHHITRKDLSQNIKEKCQFCQQKLGFDFRITERKLR